jgi:DNA replication protein DnaC
MNKLTEIKSYAGSLGLIHTRDTMEDLLHRAQESNATHMEFLTDVLGGEIHYRQDKAKVNRIKEAGFPYKKTLDEFNLDFCKSITKKQFKQLSELTWVEGLYNLILAGPPGVGYDKYLVM